MPTIIRKTHETLVEVRRDVLHAMGWQVRPGVWSPPTDAYETTQAYIVRVEAAGMREDDFEVFIQNDTLFVAGTRPDLSAERRAYHQMEIRFGKFATSVSLPVAVNVDEARAEYKDGFLVITLPKSDPESRLDT